MKLPESVRVGYKTYRIEPQNRDETDNDSCLGFANHDNCLIRSRNYGEKSECANTLLHEILHCCCAVGEAGLEHEQEERLVSILANQLLGSMQDSPEVYRWILNNANK